MLADAFPPNRQDLSVLRIVCRNGCTADLADPFLDALTALLSELRGQGRLMGRPAYFATAFHH